MYKKFLIFFNFQEVFFFFEAEKFRDLESVMLYREHKFLKRLINVQFEMEIVGSSLFQLHFGNRTLMNWFK